MSDPVYYLDGEFCSPAQARVSVLDRAFLFGDALYEVVRVENGRLFRAPDHYERMARGFGFLGMGRPVTAADFVALCAALVKRNGVRSGMVYLQVTRGVCERTHLVPRGLRPTVMGYARPGDFPKWKATPGGVAAITTPDLRWGRCDIKTTMLLPNSLAKQKAHDAGAEEAIFVSDDGMVREGASTNVCAVVRGELRSHPPHPRVLPGVTNKVALEVAREAGVPTREQPMTVGDLAGAEEAFVTSTTSDVCPVIRLDGRPVADGRIGPVTRRLMALFAERLRRETAGPPA